MTYNIERLAKVMMVDVKADPDQVAMALARSSHFLKHMQDGIAARHLDEPGDGRWTLGYAAGCGDCADLLIALMGALLDGGAR